jgi:hypothetical protein
VPGRRSEDRLSLGNLSDALCRYRADSDRLGHRALTGVVVSGIPGGGIIGELLILFRYGFPPETFPPDYDDRHAG